MGTPAHGNRSLWKFKTFAFISWKLMSQSAAVYRLWEKYVNLESALYFGTLSKVEEQRATTRATLFGAGATDVTCPSKRHDGRQHSRLSSIYITHTCGFLSRRRVGKRRTTYWGWIMKGQTAGDTPEREHVFLLLLRLPFSCSQPRGTGFALRLEAGILIHV